MKPPGSSGRCGRRLMEILAFFLMDASSRHPMEDARCFGLLRHCFSFSLAFTFWGSLCFRCWSDSSTRTGGLVGLRFLWQAGLQQVSIDCALMSSLSYSNSSCNLFQWWSKSRSGDWVSLLLISSMVLSNLANLPQPMKQPLAYHALRGPIFQRHTIQSAKDRTWKLLQMLGAVTIKPYLKDRLRSKQWTTGAINVKMPGNNVQQVSAPGMVSNSCASFNARQDLELQFRHVFTIFWYLSCQPTI